MHNVCLIVWQNCVQKIWFSTAQILNTEVVQNYPHFSASYNQFCCVLFPHFLELIQSYSGQYIHSLHSAYYYNN